MPGPPGGASADLIHDPTGHRTERLEDEADALVSSLRAGDESAFALIVDSWSGSMLRLARAHVPTDGAAEDVVQETWLAVLKGLGRFRAQSSFRSWVYAILVNQAKARGLRERRTGPVESMTAIGDGPAVDASRFQGPDGAYPGHWRETPGDWPEQVALSRELRTVVETALDTLPARQRMVVALRDVEGFTAREVTTLLGLTAGNQRVLLHRGRSVVRAHLDRYLAVPAEGGGERA